MNIHTYAVKGMTCKNCKAHVERNIRNVEGVEEVEADLATGKVKVIGKNIIADKVKESVEKGGYQYFGEIEESTKDSTHWIC